MNENVQIKVTQNEIFALLWRGPPYTYRPVPDVEKWGVEISNLHKSQSEKCLHSRIFFKNEHKIGPQVKADRRLPTCRPVGTSAFTPSAVGTSRWVKADVYIKKYSNGCRLIQQWVQANTAMVTGL